MSSPILFYEPKQPFYEFSNFYDKNGKKGTQFEIDGYSYSNVEQYYQSQKFYIPTSVRHMEYFKLICTADSPNKLFMLGTQKRKGGYAAKWVLNKKHDTRLLNDLIAKYQDISPRHDWDAVRLSIMKKGLQAKFGQNDALKTLLLDTGTKHIVENSPRDDYWGIGKNNTGKNMLGKLLMEVRDELSTH
jgi:predicted NAD-dependent protein-ADP-ribosyltransferase YbiA (DUF1768 family)